MHIKSTISDKKLIKRTKLEGNVWEVLSSVLNWTVTHVMVDRVWWPLLENPWEHAEWHRKSMEKGEIVTLIQSRKREIGEKDGRAATVARFGKRGSDGGGAWFRLWWRWRFWRWRGGRWLWIWGEERRWSMVVDLVILGEEGGNWVTRLGPVAGLCWKGERRMAEPWISERMTATAGWVEKERHTRNQSLDIRTWWTVWLTGWVDERRSSVLTENGVVFSFSSWKKNKKQK